MKRFKSLLLGAAIIANAAAAAAQAPSPRFDVASIRINRDQSAAPTRLRPILQAGGRVTLRNQTLREIIRAAYVVTENELIGGPAWIDNTDFDVDARAAGDISAGTAQAMLRALLAERFALEVHRERRDLPIYELALAARDRQRGPQLRPAGLECAAVTLPTGMPPPPPPPQGLVESIPLFLTAAPPRCRSLFLTGHVSARAMTMDAFARALVPVAGRPVVNRTGLAGEFDLELRYSANLTTVPDVTTPPELTTAMQEQLGLKLDSRRGPVEVVVIDRVMMPTEN